MTVKRRWGLVLMLTPAFDLASLSLAERRANRTGLLVRRD